MRGGYTAGVTIGTTSDWEFGTFAKTQLTGPHSGTKAWVTKLVGSYTLSTTSTLNSPIFNFSALTTIQPTLTFWQNFKSEGTFDACVLEMSTDGGTVWTKVDATLGTGGTFNTANSTGWYNDSSTNGPATAVTPPKWSTTSTAYTGHAAGWIKSTTLLPAGVLGVADVRFRWRFGSDSSTVDEGFAIDDVSVSADDVSPPVITYTPLANTVSTTDRTIAITVTDNVGVPTAGPGLPVLYFRKGTSGSFSPSQCTSSGGSGYNCTFTYASVGGVAPGDTIQYYVAAQDTAATPNVSVNPAAGASGFTANPPGATTPPTTPSAYTISVILTGSFDVGTGQTYTSLTNAGGIFEKINNNIVGSNLTINIVTDLAGETGAVALNQWAEDGVGGYTVLIKPSGAARAVTGTSTAGMIPFSGADRVTIDGSLAGGTDRSLTMTTAGTGGVIVFASGTAGAQNNTVKNVNVIGGGPTTTVIGIAFGGSTFGTAGTDNDNNRIENCSVQASIYGIYSVGASAANKNTGTVITKNVMTGTTTSRIGRIGMFVGFEDGIQITENTISGISSAESGFDAFGIAAGTQGCHNDRTNSGLM